MRNGYLAEYLFCTVDWFRLANAAFRENMGASWCPESIQSLNAFCFATVSGIFLPEKARSFH